MGMVLAMFGLGGLVGLGLIIFGAIYKKKLLMGLGAVIIAFLGWVMVFGAA